MHLYFHYQVALSRADCLAVLQTCCKVMGSPNKHCEQQRWWSHWQLMDIIIYLLGDKSEYIMKLPSSDRWQDLTIQLYV